MLPPFSLTLPHNCPEALPAGASQNVTKRIMQRQVCPPHGGRRGAKATRSLIYSRFRPWRSYRDEEGHTITVSAFHPGDNKLWIGTSPGTIRSVNLFTMEADHSWDCHQLPVTSISTSSASHRSVLMTSGSLLELGEWQAETMVWSADDLATPLLRLPDLRSPVFDTTSTRVAGLAPNNTGEIYDADTGEGGIMLRFHHAGFQRIGCGGSNSFMFFCGWYGTGSRLRQLGVLEGGDTQYKNPNICFSLKDDHIVLTDGSLWDLRAPRLLHRFDKLSNGGYGAFNHDRKYAGSISGNCS